MKYRIIQRRWLLALFLILMLSACTVSTIQAASYVKQSDTKVSIKSQKHGWVKIGRYYYFYNSKGRLLCGSIKYKGNYYYSKSNGRRYTGRLTRNGKKYYYNCKNGAMFRNRRVTLAEYRYYFNESGVAIANSWLTYKGNRYYFRSDSTMATGWQKIGKYYYYFSTKNGAMVKNKWIGNYYVDAKGRRTKEKETPPDVILSDSHYTYTSSTLMIDLQRKSTHSISYWIAHVRTKSPNQLNSALSHGTYGGSRQTTSDAVSSNGGIIGINGSAFDYESGVPSPLGMCIKNGSIYADHLTSYSVMAVKWDGTIYTPEVGKTGTELLNEGVKDTYNFGPVLIKDGVTQLPCADFLYFSR